MSTLSIWGSEGGVGRWVQDPYQELKGERNKYCIHMRKRGWRGQVSTEGEGDKTKFRWRTGRRGEGLSTGSSEELQGGVWCAQDVHEELQEGVVSTGPIWRAGGRDWWVQDLSEELEGGIGEHRIYLKSCREGMVSTGSSWRAAGRDWWPQDLYEELEGKIGEHRIFMKSGRERLVSSESTVYTELERGVGEYSIYLKSWRERLVSSESIYRAGMRSWWAQYLFEELEGEVVITGSIRWNGGRSWDYRICMKSWRERWW